MRKIGNGLRLSSRKFPMSFYLTCDMMLQITDHERLLDGDPDLQRSVYLRNGTIVPLGFLQVSLLKRLRHYKDQAATGVVRSRYSQGELLRGSPTHHQRHCRRNAEHGLGAHLRAASMHPGFALLLCQRFLLSSPGRQSATPHGELFLSTNVKFSRRWWSELGGIGLNKTVESECFPVDRSKKKNPATGQN